MNENISRLIQNSNTPSGLSGLGGEYYEFDKEKFAELLIFECLDVIIKAYKGYINPAIAVVALGKHFDLKV